MKALIELHLETSTDTEQVLQAISPDNLPLPPGLEVTTKSAETKLIMEISCRRGLKSLGATIEDLMSAIDLSLRTLKSI